MLPTWEDLFELIHSTPNVRFRDVRETFVDTAQAYNELWIAGELDEGIYRQKGTRWQQVIATIITARTGIALTSREVEGLTSTHRPDMVLFRDDGVPLVVGEAKMAGTRAHVTPSGIRRPERGGSVDLEKRLKEVKYTSVDLKLRHGGTQIGEWQEWIRSSLPHFYSFWAFLIVGRDRPEWIFGRMRSLREYYHDGIGVCMFRFEDGQYLAYEGPEFDEFDVDVAIDEIIALIGA